MNRIANDSVFVMLTDWEVKHEGIIIKTDSIQSILAETDPHTEKTRITAWLEYINVPLTLYDGIRAERFYPKTH